MSRKATSANPAPARSVDVHPDGSVTVSDAAVVLGVTGTTVHNWLKRGCPVFTKGTAGRGKGARVIVKDIVDWLIEERARDLGANPGGEDGYSYERARARDMHYRAIRREHEAYEHIGALVPIDLIAEIVEREYSEIRAGLLSLPSRLATPLSAASDPEEVSHLVQIEVDTMMRSLSGGDDVSVAAGGDPSRSIHEAIEVPEDPDAGD
jgi:phage terminase Nu1 subunit (DNA packaging protein)